MLSYLNTSTKNEEASRVTRKEGLEKKSQEIALPSFLHLVIIEEYPISTIVRKKIRKAQGMSRIS